MKNSNRFSTPLPKKVGTRLAVLETLKVLMAKDAELKNKEVVKEFCSDLRESDNNLLINSSKTLPVS